MKTFSNSLASFSLVSLIPVSFLILSKASYISFSLYAESICSFSILKLYKIHLNLDLFFFNYVLIFLNSFLIFIILFSKFNSASLSFCLDLINCLNLLSYWISLFSYLYSFSNSYFYLSAFS